MVWRTLLPGDFERAGGVEIRVVHPPAPDWERQRVRNDDSVVIETPYGEVRSCCLEMSAARLNGTDPPPDTGAARRPEGGAPR